MIHTQPRKQKGDIIVNNELTFLTDKEYRFLEFRLLMDQARLLRHTVEVHLPPKVLLFLCVLVRAENAVVTREVLFQKLWQGKVVSDESLAQVVAQCRRALGDSANQQRIIKTLPKIGFRLVPGISVN